MRTRYPVSGAETRDVGDRGTIARRLAALPELPINFDPAELADPDPRRGWRLTDRCQRLPDESPGDPAPGGSWEIARRLMTGYEFADPATVRAYYDADAPLEGRNMLLKLQALGLLHLYVGVRVTEVYERARRFDGRDARIWGWSYRTLAGHVESGEMSWEVWKWLDTGTVEFRVHSVSRSAPIANPVIRLGFHLLRGHERDLFLRSTQRRMAELTARALERPATADTPDVDARAA